VAIDRAAALRNAEKLLSKGKLDAAIAAYASVLEQQPNDWTTANTLGDLYVRAGNPDRAAELFTRSAARLVADGFAAKAAALYKKILKLRPDDERVLLQAGELAVSQGLYVDARTHFASVGNLREARGDQRGASEARVRADSVDPNDYERRMVAARLRADLDDAAGALGEFKDIAKALVRNNRAADALGALREAARLAPDDADVRTQLVTAAVAAGDFAHARQTATTVDELRVLAEGLDAHGEHTDAVEIWRLVARLTPGDRDLALRLARAFLERGDAAAAGEFLTVEAAREDPQLLLTTVDVLLQSGRFDEAVVLLRQFVKDEQDGRDQIAMLSCRLAAHAPEAGFRAIEVAVDDAASRSNWTWAAAALQEFSRRAPTYTPALLRLVEICVDGGLEELLHEAQVMLSDAYLALGSGAEARALTEDLFDREPWNMGHVQRMRRALALMGEPRPDFAIAARLSLSPHHDATPTREADAAPTAAAVPAAPVVEPRSPQPMLVVVDDEAEGVPKKEDPLFALSANAIDIGDILVEFERDEAASRDHDNDDIDLSVELNELAPIEAPDLDGVFEQLRDEVSKRSADDAAAADLQRALVLYQTGDVEGCLVPLQSAARAPNMRFAAASLLGRIFRQRGMMAEAVDWFERAAEAPAPTPAEAHAVLYELADALESEGERARALAVWLELQTDAGSFRDVAARIDRLAKVKARG